MKDSYRQTSRGCFADGSFQFIFRIIFYKQTKVKKVKDFRNYSLAQHNTFGIDAKCSRFIEYASVSEAKEAVKSLSDTDMPLLLIGG